MNTWDTNIASGAVSRINPDCIEGTATTTDNFTNYNVGIQGPAPITPFGNEAMSYKRKELGYSYIDDNNGYGGVDDHRGYIKVDKGAPAKARYAIFYAVVVDPVIFCKNRRELYKEVKKLIKRRNVDIKSIRIFGLMGGAKKVISKSK